MVFLTQPTAGYGESRGEVGVSHLGEQTCRRPNSTPVPAGTQPPQQQPQQQIARNGLGTAALILGIIGAVSGLIPFMFLAGRHPRCGRADPGPDRAGAAPSAAGDGYKGVALAGRSSRWSPWASRSSARARRSRPSTTPWTRSNKSVSDARRRDTKPSGGADAQGQWQGQGRQGRRSRTGKALEAGDSVVYDDDLTVTVSNAVAFSPSGSTRRATRAATTPTR